MTGRVLALLRALKPGRGIVVVGVELAGLAAVAYGAYLWSPGAAWIVGGVGLILEAFALERR